MMQEGFKRKLTSILSADAVGYSRLMGDDEAATVKTLTSYRNVISSLIKQHNGSVIDSPGDNLLAEFVSVVDAVQCAVAVQKELKARNDELPENRRMLFRIGINLGDVIQEDGRIYGDGVNIAARLEGLAEPGGICISKTAFDHIESKLPYGYDYIGNQTVKNISKPVGAYRVLLDPRVTVAGKSKEPKPTSKKTKAIFIGVGAIFVLIIALLAWQYFLRRPSVEPASIEKMAYPLPDRPSIAVLPFDNLSGDPEEDYISDGISENLISTLSKLPEMFVIARNSTFTYKGKAVKVQQIAEDLGVRYVLEGSVLKSGEQIRVTAQLIDAIAGNHLWAEKYDRRMQDLFQLLDDITHKIVIALQVKLTRGEKVQQDSETKSLDAWSYYIKGSLLFENYKKADNNRAREYFEQALKIDPEYVSALLMLAWTHFIDVRLGFSDSPTDSIKDAVRIAQKVSKIDSNRAELHSLWSLIYLIKRRYDEAIEAGKKSIATEPNNAGTHILFAMTLLYGGEPEEAAASVRQAFRLSPYCPAWYYMTASIVFRQSGYFQEALEAAQKLYDRAQKGEFPLDYAHWMLAAVYAAMGQLKEARHHAAEIMKLNPNFSIDRVRKAFPYKNPADLERHIKYLREAGLPEHPPLQLPDKPSIAVLPFKNISGDPEQEFLADGITESIIGAISRVSGLFVIASNSVFTYKGKAVKIQTVSRELGVQNILEGTVQKVGTRLRVNAQLIDAITGRYLWSEKYDRDMGDIFAIQDNISKEILTALQVKLVEGEQARVWAKGTNNLDAYIAFMKAYEHFRSFTKSNMILTRKGMQEAIDLDPSYAAPYAIMGSAYLIDFWMNWGESRRISVEKAQAALQKARELAPFSDLPYACLGHLYLVQGRHDDAIAAGEKSIALNPNADLNMVLLAITFNYVRRYEEAITLFREAQRRNPDCPAWYIHNLANSYRWLGRWDEAIAEYKKALEKNPDHLAGLEAMAVMYVMADRLDEGRAIAAEVIERYPEYKNPNVLKEHIDSENQAPWKYKSDAETIIDALYKVYQINKQTK